MQAKLVAQLDPDSSLGVGQLKAFVFTVGRPCPPHQPCDTPPFATHWSYVSMHAEVGLMLPSSVGKVPLMWLPLTKLPATREGRAPGDA